MEMIRERDVVGRLDVMSKNIILIKDYLEDIMMTKDDLDSIREADMDFTSGKTVRLE